MSTATEAYSPNVQALALRVALSHTQVDLHESTLPDAIAALQRTEVAAYLDANPCASVAEIADALTLSEWSVECHMWRLAGYRLRYRNPKPGKHSSNSAAHPYRAEPKRG